MPPVRPRAASRPGLVAWSRVRARLDRTRGDDGFTMVEMIVALVIIGIIMAALATFFVSTVKATAQQGTKQAAVQLAEDGIEQARALKGSGVVSRRDQTSTDAQWTSSLAINSGATAYEADMNETWDPTVTSGGSSAPLPTTGVTSTINNLVYTQNWYVGTCYQPLGGGACGKATDVATFYRVVVVVTWRDNVCTSSTCSYIATTLISNAISDPTFNSNLIAQPPSVINPGNQTGDKGSAISLTMTATGGAGAITWSGTGLPAGMIISSNGIISGTPTTVATYSVSISATDSFNLTGSAAFLWTIVAPPTLTTADQVDELAAFATYTPTLSGGTGTMTWTATPLPPGITLNTTNGTMSGTPTALNTTGTTVTVTVTDGQGQATSKTFVWKINSALQITTPTDRYDPPNVSIVAWTPTVSGGVTPYTWSITGTLPAGVTFSTSTGQFAGKPTAAAAGFNYPIKVTVADANTSVTSNYFIWGVGNMAIMSPPTTLSSTKSAPIVTVSPVVLGGTAPYTWTAGTPANANSTLPAGLAINTANGQITGTPTAVAAYTVTLKVTDANGLTASETIAWNTSSGINISSPTANMFSVVNMNITTFTAATTGGTGTWTTTGTGLPTGITITAAGVISGKPTVSGTFNVTLKVTGSSTSDTQAFTWIVGAAPNITYPVTTQTSSLSTPISSFVGAYTVGLGSLAWSATGLPAGIALSPSGVFSGTPTTAGTSSVVLSITDSLSGFVDTQAITWKVS